MENTTILFGIISACISTLVASFSGGGSSLILLPLLMIFSPGPYVSLLTTSKVAATTMTVVSSYINKKKSNFNYGLLLSLIISGLIGTGIGTYLVQYHPNEALFQQILAITLIFTAFYLSFSKPIGIEGSELKKVSKSQLLKLSTFSLFVNILNGIFGGTGILITLFLVIFFRLRFIEAIAYTMLSYLFINSIQTVYLLVSENISMPLTIGVLGGSLLGSVMGTRLQYLKGNIWVKRASIMMMLIIALKLLFT